MKQGTTEKVKFKKLKRRLRLPEWQCIGLLESVWRLACTSAPEGDIGRLSNEDIAASIEWDDDPDDLVSHLVECGWLDEDDEFRLIIHDWSEHAPNYLRGGLSKAKRQFADVAARQREQAKQVAKLQAKQVAKLPDVEEPELPPTKSSQVQPSQADSIQSNSTNTASPPSGDGPFDRFWEVVHNKVGKQAAKREFDRAVKRKAKQMLSPSDAAEFIIDAMSEFARSPAAMPRDHTPIHPATWLSQGRYDDDRQVWNRQQDNTRKKEMVRL